MNKTRRYTYKYFITTISVALILTFIVFFFFRNAEYNVIKREFNEISTEKFYELKEEIGHNLNVVYHLESFFNASEIVNREEFEIFVSNELEHFSSIQALEWVPRVLDDQRASYLDNALRDGVTTFKITERKEQGKMVQEEKKVEYYPVYYVEPLKGNEAALGFDLLSNPTRRKTLEMARDNGNMAVTSKIILVQEDGKQFAFLALLPLYEGKPKNISERRQNIIGFIVGVFRIKDIFTEAMKGEIGKTEIVTEIYDWISPNQLDLLYVSPGDPIEGIVHKTDIKVADRKWKIVNKPTKLFIDERKTLLPYSVSFVTLIISLFVPILFFAREKHHSEIELVATELRLFIENANAPIFGIGIKGRINEWNQTAYRITGYSKNDVIGKDLVEDFISEDFKKPVREVLDNALKGIETANFEFPLYSKDNKRILVLLNATTRRDASGKIIGVMGVGQDITELDNYRSNLENLVEERTRETKESLADAEEARERIDGILKSVADGLIVTDIHNRVVLMNRAAENLLNVRLSEVINRPIDFAIQDSTLTDRIIETLGKKTARYEFNFKLPTDNPEKPVIMRGITSVILDKAGNQTGIVTLMRDVTHEMEIDRMKTEFISTAAHELRTPLTSIQGFSEILITRDNLTPEEKNKFLGYINKQAVGLGKIINDLLDISRLESGKSFKLNKVICNVGDAIKQIVPHFNEQAANCEFEVKLPDKEVLLYVDKEKMGQVLKNIISNAIKYSPNGGVIKIHSTVINDEYRVSVEDEGMGMRPDEIKQVFDKFYRADSSDTAVEGTGLGMSIVKYIVEAHEGKIWVESDFGKGTKVHFTIPIADKDKKKL